MSTNAGGSDRKGVFLISALAGIIGGLCCVTPIVLVMLGLASKVYPQASFAVCHQVTTLDRAKLNKRIGTLPAAALREVELGLKAAMDLE